SAIRSFCDLIGVSKANSRVDFGKLEFAIRSDLNPEVPRVMAVARPLEVVITNWPGGVEWLDAALYPHDVPKEGSRQVPFSGRLYIEQDDFAEEPPAGWHRLAPGREVRLRYGYFITCTGVERGPDGAISRVLCTYDPATAGGAAPDGRKVKGTLHWLSADEAVPAELRLYDHLFASDTPDREDWESLVNPNSLEVLQGFVEPSLADDAAGSRYQFERLGYFISDAVDSRPGALVFNRIVTLRDSWAKQTKKDEPAAPPPAPVAEKKPDTRPTKLGRAEIRVRIRAEDADLAAAYARLQADLGLSEEDADVLTGDRELAAFFEATIAAGAEVAAATRWVVNEVLREVKDRPLGELPLTPAALAGLIGLVDAGRLSVTAGKEVFAELVAQGGDPAAIMAARGLEQLSDAGALAAAVDAVIAASPAQVERYRGGNAGLLGFFIGQVMKATGGRADPAATRALLTERLSS
ncbi:MAG: glutamine--tRNA ligase, partial [Myxococcales bacterium]|nr:glutamine--tRNA ligase [Myxococcales bacterium]